HISLSTWFKEYLYIPLGGNRTGNTYVNLLIVFFVTGLWHGSSWNFIIWGLWHGLFIVLERLVKNKNWYIKTPSFIKWAITILIVMIGWVFFNSTTMNDAFNYLLIMFGFVKKEIITFEISYYMNLRVILWIIVSIILSTPLISNISKKYASNKYFEVIKTLVLAIILIVSIIFMVNSTYSPFIYFQF
ncbi:MAG: MBOAT family O-acyltransferase, partial [Romboutsia sp.]